MAVSVINDICLEAPVSNITIAETAVKGKITDFSATDARIAFISTGNALPWVLPPEAAAGYKLTGARHRNSGEVFDACGPKPGNYELNIVGQRVGTWTDATLGFKIELQENDKTPQYQQALKVALLNKEKNDTATRPLRNFWGALKGKRSQLAQLASKQDTTLALKKDEFEKRLTNDFKPGVAKLNASVDEFDAGICDAAKPQQRKYELVRVN